LFRYQRNEKDSGHCRAERSFNSFETACSFFFLAAFQDVAERYLHFFFLDSVGGRGLFFSSASRKHLQSNSLKNFRSPKKRKPLFPFIKKYPAKKYIFSGNP